MIYTVTFNPAVDYVMHPLTLDMGFTNRSSSEEVRCGGNGINVSSILNELNVDTICLGIIAGFTGDYILETLQSAGVTCNFVRLDKGFTRINVKLNGIVMTIINGMGPKIPNDKVDELFGRLDRIKAGDTLVLTGSIPKCLPDDMYQIIMTRLAGRGIRFVVDAPGTLLLQSLESKPFLIKPNNHELGKIFEVNPETPEECMPYARKLHEQGAQNVIVSCGGEGSALVAADGKEYITKARRATWSTPPARVTRWSPASSRASTAAWSTRTPSTLPLPAAAPPPRARALPSARPSRNSTSRSRASWPSTRPTRSRRPPRPPRRPRSK